MVAAAVLAVASVSRCLTGTSVTPAMVFVVLGALVGPLVIDIVALAPTGATVRTLAEATLAIVLFADASRIELRLLGREFGVPLRLLAIGLPLTIVLGAVVARAIFNELNVGEALVLAVLLAPTDAALGQAVVSEPGLPTRIRQGLNIESGLNDGICVPILLITLAAANVEDNATTSNHALTVVAKEIGYGSLGGLAAGLAAAGIVAFAHRRNLLTRAWLQVVPIAGAGLAYGLASPPGGSGFIAAFLAGGTFGALVPRESEEASHLNEALGALLGGVTFLIFGAVLLGPALKHLSWQILCYAILSLTLVRMIPVALAMVGTGARWRTIGFLGWFGPRGLATIVFAVIVAEEAHLPGANTILLTSYLTVGLSVLAHGITAAPLARRYAQWYQAHPRHGETQMEDVQAPDQRPRDPSPSF